MTTDPIDDLEATISPDGSRVVFAGRTEGAACTASTPTAGPLTLLLEARRRQVAAPTFSPDGTQIAYIVGAGDHSHHVWVMNADGSDAHEIVFNESTRRARGTHDLAWSPAGDRIALGSVDDPRSIRSPPMARTSRG